MTNQKGVIVCVCVCVCVCVWSVPWTETLCPREIAIEKQTNAFPER